MTVCAPSASAACDAEDEGHARKAPPTAMRRVGRSASTTIREHAARQHDHIQWLYVTRERLGEGEGQMHAANQRSRGGAGLEQQRHRLRGRQWPKRAVFVEHSPCAQQ